MIKNILIGTLWWVAMFGSMLGAMGVMIMIFQSLVPDEKKFNEIFMHGVVGVLILLVIFAVLAITNKI